MNNLLDITRDDIPQLRDDDLRRLIGLLCEADYRSAGLPTRGISSGGHQDAADGGLDVVVRDEVEPPSNSFVPKRHTGFQVKKPDMPRAKILEEMRPNGVLRDSIKELIQAGGAYLIISSKASTTDNTLKNRIDAMREAVKDEENSDNLHIDFLDQGRIATWVRNHPSLILWVRNKIGRALQGWRPYENWANSPGGVEEEYLLDDGLRLHDGTGSNCGILSVQDGLLRLRRTLSSPRSSVRLVGLSGVGKTRLVQVLFDERTGEQPLASSLAIYTDISDSSSPEPGAMAEQLVALQSKTILIVDNCPPDLHRRLTKTCTQSNSTVSLLTIEYDVRDDLPEETSVFKLEPASEELICKLLRKRFSHISQVDAQTIAEFSGGNARIALALANTVRHGESLSSFRDNDLFERLFWQTDQQKDKSLLRSAEVCALVYSFDGEDSSAQSELQFLASFTGTSATVLHSDVAELKRREIVQSRSVWRAVLPQAIANWLAKRALESIPKDVLVPKFLGASERLIKSFTRRLGYLHDCEEVVEIVDEWLEPDGWIGKHVSNLSKFGMEVFVNIAPVSPAKTLAAIERAAQETEEVFAQHQSRFVDLLQKLAYEPELFDRCARLLYRVPLSEQKKETVLKSLFYIHFSGPNTPVKERARIIEELIEDAENYDKQNLAWHLLKAALTVRSFPVDGPKGFGARSREYNFYPEKTGEALRWFPLFIDICAQIALSNLPTAEWARKLLADKLNELWVGAGVFTAIEEAAKKIHAQKGWHQGWLAVRRILRKKHGNFSSEVIEKLSALEESLRPVGLLERARTYAFSERLQRYGLEDDFKNEDRSERYRKVEKITRSIACQVAQTPDVLNIMLPELVSAHTDTYHGRLDAFGKGLADGAADKAKLFQSLRSEFIKMPPEQRSLYVFKGFLASCAEIDQALYNTLLDGLVEDEVLGEWFPQLQERCKIDQQGIERLHRSLDIGKAPVTSFKYLGWGHAYDSLSDDDLAELVRKILLRENGAELVVEILANRNRNKEKQLDIAIGILNVMRDALCLYQFYKNEDEIDYDCHCLAELATICLAGSEGADAARTVCQRLIKSIIESNHHANDYSNLVRILAQLQPIVFLNSFLGQVPIKSGKIPYQLTCYFNQLDFNQLDEIIDKVLLDWCKIAPEQRYPLVASLVTPFSTAKEQEQITWRPVVYAILEHAPNIEVILKQFADVIEPMAWSGSRAELLEKRSALLQAFYEHPNELVRNWAKSQYADLQNRIEDARKSEQEREEQSRRQNERFE